MPHRSHQNQHEQRNNFQRAPVNIPSLTDFILMLQEHTFSFSIQNHVDLERFVNAQRYEAKEIFPIAWSGGDQYMIALQRAMTRQAEVMY